MQDFEKLGAFYLGHTVEEGETNIEAPVLYPAKDLTTHGLCVGMTGSGKTGLSVILLEEAALDGIPAIAIDPKGDLGNLFLTFPELRPEDFAPWIDPAEASRKGRTPEEHAAATAELWRSGLERHGQGPERVARLEQSVERAIYTPGSTAGRPLSVLERFTPPPAEIRADADALREEVSSSASALCALLDIDPDPIASTEHILLSTLLVRAYEEERELGLPELVREVLDPPFDRVGALPLDDFCAPKDRKKLGMRLNNLLASPGFSAWLEGEALDVGRLLYTEEGRPKLSVLSIAHLSERERMFFVTLLLQKVITWMRGQPGTSSLRAMLFMDEVFGFFPPVKEPPSKRPMLTLLKQARAYGLGVLLATQNPVDLDYKGLSNCGTWFLGRLSTERDVDRVLEGLRGASSAAGANLDEKATKTMLAGLESRRFLMRNVHEDVPVTFDTRWAMSYLRGPLTRAQIGELAAEGRPTAPSKTPEAPAASPSGAPTKTSAKTSPPSAEASSRPALDPAIAEKFVTPIAGDGALEWRAGALATVTLHHAHRHSGLDAWTTTTRLAHLGSSAEESWIDAPAVELSRLALADEPPVEGLFGALPRFASSPKGFGALENALEDRVHQHESRTVFRCEKYKAWSKPDEDRAAFVARMELLVREERDRKLETLRERYQREVDKLETKIDRAEDKVEREKRQYSTQKVDTAVTVGGALLGAIFGRRVLRRATSAVRSGNRAARARGDIERAEEAVRDLQEDLTELKDETKDAIGDIKETSIEAPPIETRDVRPTKRDIRIEGLSLVWLPYRAASEGEAPQPAWSTGGTSGV